MLLDNPLELFFLQLNIYYGTSLHFLLIKTDLSIFHFSALRDSRLINCCWCLHFFHWTETINEELCAEMHKDAWRWVKRPTRLHFKYLQDFFICIYIEKPREKFLILYYCSGEIPFTVLSPCLLDGLSQPVMTPFCGLIQNCRLLKRLRM